MSNGVTYRQYKSVQSKYTRIAKYKEYNNKTYKAARFILSKLGCSPSIVPGIVSMFVLLLLVVVGGIVMGSVVPGKGGCSGSNVGTGPNIHCS